MVIANAVFKCEDEVIVVLMEARRSALIDDR